MPVTVTRVSDDGFSAWHQQDAPAPEALGGGHRDVIFLQCRDHVGAQHAHQHRPFAETQRDCRQHEAAQVRDDALIERHISGGRQPFEPYREEVDQHDRQHECRHRQLAECDRGHQAVEDAAIADRAEDAERYADREGDQLSEQHQLKGHRQTLEDCRQHLLPGAERSAEIADEGAAEPMQVLHDERLVESHLAAQCRDFFRRRLIGEHGDRQIAGQQCRDQEGQQRDGD
jgi:hypothetical protein